MSPVPASCQGLLLALVMWQGVARGENDAKTSLIVAPHYELVGQHCLVCHSSKLITQNRADRQGWLSMIRWMQEKQGLWPLGSHEAKILDYLTENYGPSRAYRRKPLDSYLMPVEEVH